MLVCTDYNRGFRFIGKMCCYNILDTDDWVSEMISGAELLSLLYTNKINVCNILQRSNVSYEITPWSFSIVEDGVLMEKSYYLMVSLQLHRMLVVCSYGIGGQGV